MSHALPLLDMGTQNDTSSQQHIKPRRCSIQENKSGTLSKKSIKASQSCNPLYMVMDPLQPHAKKIIDDAKRKTISYI